MMEIASTLLKTTICIWLTLIAPAGFNLKEIDSGNFDCFMWMIVLKNGFDSKESSEIIYTSNHQLYGSQ